MAAHEHTPLRARKLFERALRRAGVIWTVVGLVAATHFEQGAAFVFGAIGLVLLGVACVVASIELAVRRRHRRGGET